MRARHDASDGGRFTSVVRFVPITRGRRSSTVKDYGGECVKEVETVQESFPRSILYENGEKAIKDGVYKSSSRKHDGGAL